MKDLKAMIDKISFLLKNERINYLLNFESDKSKNFNHLPNNFVKFMTKFIVNYVLTQM